MKHSIILLHTIGVLLVLAICVVLAMDSTRFAGYELFAITYERIYVAVLCGLFAAAHLVLLAKKRATVKVSFLFYPLCFLLAVATADLTRNIAKGWAPATASEAAQASFLGYGIVVALVVACIASCFWALSVSKRRGA